MEESDDTDGQLRATDALAELIRAGLPPVHWAVWSPPAYLSGLFAVELSDTQKYVHLARWADVLGTPLRTTAGTSSPPEDSSEPAWRTERYERSPWESLEIDCLYRDVRVRFSAGVEPGTTERTRMPRSRPVRSRTAVHTAQLRSVTALTSLLIAGLPPVAWDIDGRGEEPALTGRIPPTPGRRLRDDLAAWADFLGNPVVYRSRKRTGGWGTNRWGEATGTTLDVPVGVTAAVRPPLPGFHGHHPARP
ncbi:hypothetical protein [Streptomyces sp. NBC_01198]|uniref:hypothetical protein n=1 Tax=Streptomyces sp. NBC_01198 TaxID=2903769 RepID=UPI002E0DEF7D|nr:hypothetical protein OG702_17565 [Streptomyces sp. NBC_01198]